MSPETGPETGSEVSPLRKEITLQMAEHERAMDESVQRIVQRCKDSTGRDLSADRMRTLDRKTAIIRDKMRFVTESDIRHHNEFLRQRDVLLKEVQTLLSYAQYQVENQQDIGATGGDLDAQVWNTEKGSGRQIWVPIADPATSLLKYSYVTSNPGISRLCGTSSFEPRTISAKADTYEIWRAEDKGKHYMVVSVGPGFDGTFSFFVDGKSKTVDVLGDKARVDRTKMREREKERAAKVIPEESKELGEMRAQLSGYRSALGTVAGRLQDLHKRLSETVMPTERKKLLKELKVVQKEAEHTNGRVTELNAVVAMIRSVSTDSSRTPDAKSETVKKLYSIAELMRRIDTDTASISELRKTPPVPEEVVKDLEKSIGEAKAEIAKLKDEVGFVLPPT